MVRFRATPLTFSVVILATYASAGSTTQKSTTLEAKSKVSLGMVTIGRSPALGTLMPIQSYIPVAQRRAVETTTRAAPTPKKKKLTERSTSSSSGDNKKSSGDADQDHESIGISDSSKSSKSKSKNKKYEAKSTQERHGWRKWHRKCQKCVEDEELKWRDPRVKWICGAYQRARRSFKSECLMYKRNCQDGTMFIKIHEHRCDNDTSWDPRPHGAHFFYDYKAKILDESSESKSDSESSTGSSSSGSI